MSEIDLFSLIRSTEVLCKRISDPYDKFFGLSFSFKSRVIHTQKDDSFYSRFIVIMTVEKLLLD